MSMPPRTAKEGLFSLEVIADIFVYGMLMGGISLGCYAVALEASPFLDEGKNVPHKCNEHYSSICDDVFRARGACFASLSLLLLVHAYNCRDMRRSVFESKLMDNKLLFWTCFGGIFLVVPTFYIPGLNTEVLKQKPLSWEWAPVLAGIVIFEVFVEMYKWLKRRFLPHPVPRDIIKASLAKFGSAVFNEPRDVRDKDPAGSNMYLPDVAPKKKSKKSIGELPTTSADVGKDNGTPSIYVVSKDVS